MQASEMTLEDCCTWLARVGKHRATGGIACNRDRYYREEDRIPATLDAAAAALPEGWKMFNIGWQSPTIEARAINADYRTVYVTADTELLARFRLAVAVRQAQGAANGK